MSDAASIGRMSLAALIEQRAAAAPDRIAVYCRDTATSFDELCRRSRRVAHGLKDVGVGDGDRVLLWLATGVDWIEVYLAVARLGATVVPVNPYYTAAEFVGVAEVARPAAVLVDDRDDLADVRGELSDRLGSATPLVLVVGDGDGRGRVRVVPGAGHPTTDLPVGREFHPCLGYPTEPEVVFSSSGSTGRPKLVAHGRAGVATHVEAASRALHLGSPSTVVAGFVPLCGVYGFMTAFATLVAGRPLVLLPRFDAATAVDLIERFQITHGAGSDQLVRRLFAAAEPLTRLRSLREWSFGTFGNDAVELVGLGDRAGIAMYNIYGSSEILAYATCQPVSATPALRAVPGGVFTSPGTRLRVRDPQSGRLLAAGDVGQMEITGPNAMLGYLTPTGVDTSTLTGDGWVRTGDLGVQTADGLRFVGRGTDSLRLSGFLVEPEEIEVQLKAFPGVAEAKVVGVGTDLGTRAVAFVLMQPGAVLDEPAAIAHTRAGLATFKVPSRIVPVTEFPRIDSPNGPRINRVALRDMAGELMPG